MRPSLRPGGKQTAREVVRSIRTLKRDTQRVLLTGGAGFIGSHVAEALLGRGFPLTIIDNLDGFYSPAWKNANLEDVRRVGSFAFHAVDICEFESLRSVFKEAQPKAVIHLAARAGVRPSLEQPRQYQQVNVAGTLNLLESCREFGVRRLLFGSSSSVYGDSSRVPFSEDHVELRPISPYAVTKLSGEMLCYTYSRLFHLGVACLRFFTVYGPRQRPDLAIHKFTALLEAGKPLPVYGNGSSGRDYTYVSDIVAGVLAALDYSLGQEREAGFFEVLNLGNSRPVKLTELIALLECVTGRTAIREEKPPQPGDMQLTWADVSKARRLLGYQPATSLEEGLRLFVDWYRAVGPGRRA